MPRLPSGQHVAVDPTPLRELLKRTDSPSSAHHLMSIEQVDDLYRWLDVLTLVPADSLRADQQAGARRVDAAPAGLLGLPIGRLSDWEAIARDWSDADRHAFRTFIDERIRPAASDGMWRPVQACRQALLKSRSMAGAFAHMWRLGIHPLQDTGLD